MGIARGAAGGVSTDAGIGLLQRNGVVERDVTLPQLILGDTEGLERGTVDSVGECDVTASFASFR